MSLVANSVLAAATDNTNQRSQRFPLSFLFTTQQRQSDFAWMSPFLSSRSSSTSNVDSSTSSTLQLLFDPPLHPLLSPLPGLFRLLAFLIVAPVIFFCLVDFAGYAVFRTLGLHRQRVRIKRPSGKSNRTRSDVSRISLDSSTSRGFTQPNDTPATTAPLLTPGAYDADELLRHRARSISVGSQAEAAEEWTRTGGNFARVSTVRAREAAASATMVPSTSSIQSGDSLVDTPLEVDTGSGGGGDFARQSGLGRVGAMLSPEYSSSSSSLLSPPESPRAAFARTRGVGMEGAMGYFDTDVEDSGAESGSSSPLVGFDSMANKTSKGSRRGLAGARLGFTPMEEGKDGLPQQMESVPNALDVALSDREGQGGLQSEVGQKPFPKANSGATSPFSFVGGSFSNERSPTGVESMSSSSWISDEEQREAAAQTSQEVESAAAAAADLEPFMSQVRSAE